MNKKIVTFGEILFRLSKENHYRLTQGHVFNGDYGGSEANVAVSLAVMNDEVEYVTRVPDNAIGRAALTLFTEVTDLAVISLSLQPLCAIQWLSMIGQTVHSLHSNMEILTGNPSSKMPCFSTARASLVP